MWQKGLKGIIDNAFQTEQNEIAELKRDKETLLHDVKTDL